MKDFWYYYLRSMRLYYCFVTGTATLAGCIAARGVKSVHLPFWDWRDAVVLIIGFLAWGVNQVVSDWFDRKEDALNAPHRPMVSGKLAPRPALILSGSLMALFAVMAYLVSPVSLLILIVGGLLNLLYSQLKWIPVLNTLIYGAAITCCTFFGLSAHCDLMGNGGHWILPVLCFWGLPPHILMCHNSYFKDIEGDRAAGLRTLPALFPRFSWWLGMILSAGWTLFLALIPEITLLREAGKLFRIGFNWYPLIRVLTLFGFLCMMLYLTLRLFVSLHKKEYHPATRLNCQLCVAWLFAAPGMFYRPLWLTGAFVSVLLIEILYRWYPDEKE